MEQSAYHAKPGMAEAVYQQRIHASEVRVHIGLPYGRVFRRTDGAGSNVPDVIWQLEYADVAAQKFDLDVRAKSPAFEEVRSKMSTLIADFGRGFYQPAQGR